MSILSFENAIFIKSGSNNNENTFAIGLLLRNTVLLPRICNVFWRGCFCACFHLQHFNRKVWSKALKEINEVLRCSNKGIDRESEQYQDAQALFMDGYICKSNQREKGS